MKTRDEAIQILHEITTMFRMYVKEREMDEKDISKLVYAETYADSVLKPIVTMHKENVVMADGNSITEPNEVTALFDIAAKIGMKIRIPDPDADVLPDGNFDYHEWTKSPQEAWQQMIAMYMAVDEDFTIEFENEDNPFGTLSEIERTQHRKHVHWIKIVSYGGNTPDDGWLNDSCTCEIMDTLWK